MAEQWLSIVEYARTFAVSDMTVRRRIKTGRLKAVLREGKYYIPVGPNGEILDFDDSVDITPPPAALPVAAAPAPVVKPSLPREPVHREAVRQALPREIVMPAPESYAREAAMPAREAPMKREAAREASPDGLVERTGAATYRMLPSQVTQGLQRTDQSLVDSAALLQFCDNSVSRFNSMEKQLQDVYQSRIHTLESQLKWKDGVISQLKQQVEDLQMLVTLMEQSRR